MNTWYRTPSLSFYVFRAKLLDPMGLAKLWFVDMYLILPAHELFFAVYGEEVVRAC